jgi:hypothetical protein
MKAKTRIKNHTRKKSAYGRGHIKEKESPPIARKVRYDNNPYFIEKERRILEHIKRIETAKKAGLW